MIFSNLSLANVTTPQTGSRSVCGMKMMTSSLEWSNDSSESLTTSWDRASSRSALYVERWMSGTTWVSVQATQLPILSKSSVPCVWRTLWLSCVHVVSSSWKFLPLCGDTCVNSSPYWLGILRWIVLVVGKDSQPLLIRASQMTMEMVWVWVGGTDANVMVWVVDSEFLAERQIIGVLQVYHFTMNDVKEIWCMLIV